MYPRQSRGNSAELFSVSASTETSFHQVSKVVLQSSSIPFHGEEHVSLRRIQAARSQGDNTRAISAGHASFAATDHCPAPAVSRAIEHVTLDLHLEPQETTGPTRPTPESTVSSSSRLSRTLYCPSHNCPVWSNAAYWPRYRRYES